MGLGLRLMGYRCALIGGTLGIQTSKDGGTQVSCAIPQVPHA
jgi:signal transduction histidine kinase